MKNNTTRDSILGGLAWKFGERIISQGVGFVISIILARILLPELYGIIAIVQVFINLSAVFITSGFATSLIQKRDADRVDFSTMFYCSLAVSVVIYFILFFAAPLIAAYYKTPELTAVLRVFSLQLPISALNSIQNAYVSRNMMFRYYFRTSLISSILSGAIGIWMAMAGFGVWALVAQSIAATVVNTLVLLIMLPWKPELLFSGAAAKSLMRYGSKILLADLSGTFFNEIRALIIGGVYTNADLAFYSKGQQLPSLLTTNISSSVMTVLFPAMSNESSDLGQVKQMTRKSISLLSYVMFPILGGLAAVMAPLIIFLFTDAWAESIPYAQVLSVGFAINVVGSIPIQTIKAIGRSDTVLNLEFIKKPVYVLLLIIGVKISVFGVAVSMLVYEIYGYVINMSRLKKHVDYGFIEQLRDLAPATLLSVAMAAVVLLIPTFGSLILTLIVKVAAGVLVYVGLSIVLRIESFTYIKNTALGMLKRSA